MENTTFSYLIIPGKNSAICGKTVTRKTTANMAKRKKNAPLKTVPMGTSATPEITNIFNPRGGVISPASIIKTEITPNHMGLNPSFKIVGNITGKVNTIMDVASRKHPRTR